MPKRRRRANWPYRLAWFTIIATIVLYIGLGTLVGGLTYGYRTYGIDWWIAFVSTLMSATVAVWFVAIGASVGSFLNVVAYRLPLGRTVGGHSGCPYCCTPIESRDNVPVLGWIKLRGRCRTCRLPISAQYPIVEFLVAMIFLSVFFTEVARGGVNLPNERVAPGMLIYQVSFTSTFLLRLVSYMTVICGLVASSLIVIKRQVVPLQLFAWSLVPLVFATIADPGVNVLLFSRSLSNLGPVDSRLFAFASIMLGGLAGLLVGWLTSKVVSGRLGFNATWIAGFAMASAVVGWQSIPMLLLMMIAAWLLGQTLLAKYQNSLDVQNAATWQWLGLLLFRAGWRWFDGLQILPATWPELLRVLIGIVAALGVCSGIARLYPHRSDCNDEPNLLHVS